MNLYLIQFDHMSYYVEAKTFAEAIELWTARMKDECDEWTDKDQPESVALVHEDAVIRREPLLDMLRELEWAGSEEAEDGEDHRACPWCGCFETESHSADCKLAALLSQAEAAKP